MNPPRTRAVTVRTAIDFRVEGRGGKPMHVQVTLPSAPWDDDTDRDAPVGASTRAPWGRVKISAKSRRWAHAA